jgi:hypothetical protein
VNQRETFLKVCASSNLTDLGWFAALTRAFARGTLWPFTVIGREVTVNVCGVTVTSVQGHSWAPHLSNGSR